LTRILIDFRVLDIFALLIIALVLASPVSIQRKQYVPQVGPWEGARCSAWMMLSWPRDRTLPP
jgi:hypothetical protein